MKTQEEIKKEIKALKAVRPKVRPHNMFGDDNLAMLDAQVDVLENYLDSDDIYERYDHADASEYVLEGALEAWNWVCDESESDSLVEDMPLKQNLKKGKE